MTDAAVVLVAHGTVDSLDELPEFLTNIRRGHAPPPELLAEVRRRYEAIGGQSPLNTINRFLAERLEAKLGVKVRLSNRLFRPYPKDVLTALARVGVKKIAVVPLAQHSAPVYADAVRAAAKEVPEIERVECAPNWGRDPALARAFADIIARELAKVPRLDLGQTTVLFTAHSLPLSIIEGGDPYEKELRGSADDVVRELRARAPGTWESQVAFQSQGMSTGPGGRPMAWLGPDLKSTLTELAKGGKKHVVVAPIGFLADHVEILYDLDIEAKSWGEELGIVLYRSPSLNADAAIVDTLAGVAAPLLRAAG